MLTMALIAILAVYSLWVIIRAGLHLWAMRGGGR
jgi:hypothetical protein